MQPAVFNFVKKYARQGTVLDIGSFDVNGNVRELFEGSDYTGLDMRPGKNVDMVANAHNLPFEDNYFDTIVCLEMLEHDDNPFSTAAEIKRVIKRDGQIIICASGIGMKKHEFPADYWRFTKEAFLKLFQGFETVELIEGKQEVFFSGIKTDKLPIETKTTKEITEIDDPYFPKEKVSIIIPVIRPESAKRCIEAIKKNAGIPLDQFEIIDSIDSDGIGCPKMIKALTRIAKHDLVMFLGDDAVPQKDFLKNALKEMDNLPDGWGVIGLNTEGPTIESGFPENSNPFAHWLAHKKILEHIPGNDFFPIEYNHCWCDAELKDIADELKHWAFAEDSIVEHRHPINKSAEYDEGYQKAYSDKAVKHDRKTYLKRKRKRMQKKHDIRLALAFPLTDIWNYSHFTFSILNVLMNHMVHLFQENKSVNLDLLFPDYPGQIDAVRNDLVNQALDLGCTHVLMMDTDQIYADIETIEKLLAHNLPVVGAKVHRRYPPFDPILLAEVEEEKFVPISDEAIEKGDLIKVGATGCGCILYDTQVFFDIDDPWFEITSDKYGRTTGEDIGFCIKLREKGIDIYVDCSIDIKHLATLAVDWATFKLYQKLKGAG